MDTTHHISIAETGEGKSEFEQMLLQNFVPMKKHNVISYYYPQIIKKMEARAILIGP